MNKFSKLASLGLLSSAIIFSGTSFAHMHKDAEANRKDCHKTEHHQGKWSKKGEHRGLGNMKRALHHLDLSKDQQVRVEAIMQDAKPAMESMRLAMKDSRAELRDQMQSSEYDENAVQQAANNQADLMAQKLVFMAKTRAEVFQVLTPEQQQTLIEKFESKKHR